MSYADANLDWRTVHIACLTGRNGAGKSAILDAVTWALWESARGTSDELIRLGQTEMWVDVRFSLNGQVYRVRRSRSRNAPRPGGKLVSRGTLELQMLQQPGQETSESSHRRDGVNPMRSVGSSSSAKAKKPAASASEQQATETAAPSERWVSLTAASMKETQQRINDLLKMQYDTFINSVYLRQGRADEFTQKSAGERKDVLAEILGLKYFDRLQEAARDEARLRKAQIEKLQSTLPDVVESERERARLTDELQAVAAAAQELQALMSRHQEDIETFRIALEASRQADKMLTLKRERHTELVADLNSVASQSESTQGTISRFEKLLGRASHLDAEQQRFSKLTEELQSLDKAALSVHELLDRRQKLRSALAEAKGRMEVELDHWREQVVALTARRKKLQRDTKDRKKIESAYHEYKTLAAEEALLTKQQELHASLLARAEQLQFMIGEARMKLEAEIGNQQTLLSEFKLLIDSKTTLESEQQGLVLQARNLDRVDAEFSLVEEKGLRIKSEIESLQSEIRELRRRCQENDDKLTELIHQPHASTCPLCASPIVDRAAVAKRYADQTANFQHQISDLENRVASFEDERAQLRTQYSELRQLIVSRKQLDQKIGEYNERQSAIARAESAFENTLLHLKRLEERLAANEYSQVERESLINIKAELHKMDFDPIIYSSLQSQLRAQRHAEVRYHTLQKDLQSLAELEQQLPAFDERIALHSQQLKDETFAAETRVHLSELEAEIAGHKYDQARHGLVREELNELMPMVEEFRQLGLARAEMPALKQQALDLTETKRVKTAQRDDLAHELQQLQADVSAGEKQASGLDVATQELRAAQEAHSALLQQRGALAANIEHHTQKLEAMQSKQGELRQLVDEMNDFLQLAEALGKKGIQALIIENAIPELESEANRILARLTENQMHIGLLTQQRTRQGNAIETLDIVIADDLGTRNYELFSGGEAFKVNFALRLALSRLLARRAGAKLETLIIDEGFGSQDEDSRHRLLNAINAVSCDFARIIVVSHIAEVQEMFPTQIHVRKEGGVSVAEIVR